MADPPEIIEAPIAEQERARFDARRLAMILGVVVAVFVLVWLLFLRGGGEPPPPENLPALITPAPTPSSEPTDADRRKGRVETFEVFAARDPFEPLAGTGVGDETGAEGGDAGGDAGTTDGTDTDGEADTGPDGGADGGGGDGSANNVGDHRVRVVDVFPRGGRAQIQVDGTVYTVDEGETFAENFELVRASGQCATMLFGDDEFTLCEGEEVLK